MGLTGVGIHMVLVVHFLIVVVVLHFLVGFRVFLALSQNKHL
jgi:hypothetical protein